MWNDEIKREEGVSLDRWKSKNLLWLKKCESDFRTKYTDKKPFIKETETKINIQTYPQRRPGRNKSPQGRNLNNPDIHRQQIRDASTRMLYESGH